MGQDNNAYAVMIQKYFKLVDKKAEYVPFRLNEIQRKFLLEDMTGRDVVLKARQQGFSSLILGIFAIDFLVKKNTYNVVVADNSDNALGLLKRVKDFLRSYCELTGLNIDDLLKYNSKYELYIEAINSTYHIGTAQNSQFGRSKTITNLHLSEMAFYPAIDEILAGAMQAVTPQGRVIIETTANGHNKFKDFWDSIQRGESNFKSHFYKASDFYSDKFLQAKKKELGRLYKQEYPETDTEAFISSGDTYFDSQALEWHLRNVKPTIGGGYV